MLKIKNKDFNKEQHSENIIIFEIEIDAISEIRLNFPQLHVLICEVEISMPSLMKKQRTTNKAHHNDDISHPWHLLQVNKVNLHKEVFKNKH